MALSGKSAIVTGGAGGTGLAIVERLVGEGARVIFADTDMDAGHEAEERLAALGSAVFVKADVSRRLDIHNLVAAALNLHGEIDLLVTAASYRRTGEFLSLREDELDRVFAVNLKGTFLAAQAVGRCMSERVDRGGEPGSIVMVGVLDAALPSGDFTWSIVRPAIHDLARATAAALARWRIPVNAIGLEAGSGPEATDAAVAATAAWLGSGAAGALTGALLAPGDTGLP